MPYANSDLTTVLNAIVTRIVAQTAITGFTNDTVYIAPHNQVARLVPPKPGYFNCSVAMGDGSFDEGLWEGGGTEQTCLDATVSVTIYSINKLDPPGHEKQALLHATQGLSAKIKAMLKVLSAHLLLDGSGNQIVRMPLRPAGFRIPELDPNLHGITLDFALSFDWDLS